jgi:putative inorganic carbon (hco3(-)) transporter
MRDLSLILTLAVLLAMTLRFPIVGLYTWVWIAIHNPHRLAFGFAQSAPFNLIIAIVTGLAWLLSKERKHFEWNAFSVLLLVFSAWITLTTVTALVPEATYPLWDRNIKTMALLVMIMVLVNNRVRLIGLMWVMAVSIGYFGVKGGAFMIATAGNYIVFGPPSTQIEDNNALALACTTIIPIINYLRIHTPHRLLKFGLTFAMGMTIISVLGSYSRGGLIALAAMMLFLWLRSRTKLLTITLAIMVGAMAFVFMPQKYMDRISTISEASEDSSFQGRLDAWTVAWHVALEHPLGAGFEGPQQPQVWERYLPAAKPRASHSIYFMVLGEHGFTGLILWLSMLFAAWRAQLRVQKLTRNRPELLWAKDLSQALQVASVGFMVGGAALPMAYYDGFLTLLTAGVILRSLVQKQLGHQPRAVAWQAMPVLGRRASAAP